MTDDDESQFRLASSCHICNLPFATDVGPEAEEKVRDHCHLTGKYRGPAHNSCNINFKITCNISIVFHNLVL